MNRLWIILLTATAVLSCAAAPAIAFAEWVVNQWSAPAIAKFWFAGALVVAGVASSWDVWRLLAASLAQRWRCWHIRRVQHRWSRRAIH